MSIYAKQDPRDRRKLDRLHEECDRLLTLPPGAEEDRDRLQGELAALRERAEPVLRVLELGWSLAPYPETVVVDASGNPPAGYKDPWACWAAGQVFKGPTAEAAARAALKALDEEN